MSEQERERELLARGGKVEAIAGALGETGMVKRAQRCIIEMVDTEGWREYLLPPEYQVLHRSESFEGWVNAFPFKGLGMTLDDLYAIAAGNAKCVDAIDRATQRGDGGNNNPSGCKGITVDNVNGDSEDTIKRPTGNSARRGIRKLREEAKHDPAVAEVYQQVLANKVSAHAAMVRLGFRKPSKTYVGEPVERVTKALRDLEPEEAVEPLAEYLRILPTHVRQAILTRITGELFA